MFKIFGRRDLVREDEDFSGSTEYSHIELYSTGDSKTGFDIERPIRNMYRNQHFLLSAFENYITTENVINGKMSGFEITNDDVVQLDINGEIKNYIRIPPGVAVVKSLSYGLNQERDNQTLVVKEPQTAIAERQIGKILRLGLLSNLDDISIKYIQNSGASNDTFKGKIVKKRVNSNFYDTYYFGCANEGAFIDDSSAGLNTGVELINEIYNTTDFTIPFDVALNKDLTLITLEPVFLIQSLGTSLVYFDETDFGKIKIDLDTGSLPSALDISSINVTDWNVGSLTFTIDNTVSPFVTDQKNLIATGDTADSINFSSTLGGITENAVDFDLNAVTSYNLTSPVMTFTGAVNIVGTLDPGDFVDVNVKDLVLTLNSDDVNLTAGQQSGIVIDRGSELNYNMFFDHDTSDFLAGEDGSEYLVALVDNAKVQDSLIRWNGNHFEFINNMTFTPETSLGAKDGTLLIDGNLTVKGTTTTVDSEDLQIEDNVILLNKGEGGAGVTDGTAGIEIERGTEDNFSLLFYETNNLLKTLTGTYEKLVPEVDLTPALNSVIGNTIVWDDTNKRFNFDTGIKFEPTLLTFSKDTTFSLPVVTNSTITANGDNVLGVTGTTTTTIKGTFDILDKTLQMGSKNVIRTKTDTNGDGVFVGGGGIGVYGGGEAASEFYTNATVTTENSYLAGDINAVLSTNLQSGWASKKDNLTAWASGRTSVSGAFRIGATTEANGSGDLTYEASAPSTTGTSILSYNGYFYATRVYNSTWNDLAEFFLSESPVLSNHVYVIGEDGKVKLSDKYGDKDVVGICSDTPAFIMKQEYEKDGGVPLALAGTVTVAVVGSIKKGDMVTSYRFGKAKKANLFIRLFRRDALIGKVMSVSEKELTAFVLVK